MALRVYKYRFEVLDRFKMDLPKGASILTVQTQNEQPCIWAIVDDTQAELQARSFRVFGTGHALDFEAPVNHYIGTFQMLAGRFIGHLFEDT